MSVSDARLQYRRLVTFIYLDRCREIGGEAAEVYLRTQLSVPDVVLQRVVAGEVDFEGEVGAPPRSLHSGAPLSLQYGSAAFEFLVKGILDYAKREVWDDEDE